LSAIVAGLAAGSIQAVAAQELEFSAYVWLEPGRGDGIWAVVEECAAEQDGLTVRQAAVPFAKYGDVILQQLAAGAGPDIMQLRINQFALAAQAGLLADLDGLVDETALPGLTAVNAVGVVDGVRYGYLEEVTNNGLFYNVSMFEDAGIAPPRTFEEFLDAGKKLTNPDEGQYGLSFRATMAELNGWQTDFSYFVFGYGADWVDAEGRPTFDTPEMKQAVEAYLEVYNSGIMPVGADAATFRRMFAEGKIAMLLQNQNVPITIEAMNEAMKGNIKAIVPPFPSGKQPMIAAMFSINKNSPNQEAAGKLLQCLLTPEKQQKLAVALGGGSPAVDVYAAPSPELQALLDNSPWLGEVEKNAAANSISAIPLNAQEVFAKYTEIFFEQLSRIQAGDATVDEGLAKAQELAMAVAEEGLGKAE
jgi:multiple sugar transport system substrate-binding protein